MTPSFTIRVIEAGGERLPCVLRGPADGTPLLIVPPLFEEMNRTRRLLALVGARLGERGIRSCLPDLPGTGDHEEGAAAMDWRRWRVALSALGAALGRPHVFAVRGGALLGDAVEARSFYRLAPPASGAKLLRELWRARVAADREAGVATAMADLDSAGERGETIEAAGYALSPALVRALRGAELPAPPPLARTVATTPSPTADTMIEGPPVWRQAEPADPTAFADRLAADLHRWVAGCDGRS